MKVILKKRVPNLGQAWDVVNVKGGYARNYLIPQDLADWATPALIKAAEKKSAERVRHMEEVKANAKEMVDKLSKVSLKYSMKAKAKKLYGSISEKDIVDFLLKEHKIELNKEMVHLPEHLKTLGDHKVKIHLAEGMDATITVSIEAEKEAKK